MPRTGENIYHRKDGRWEGRYVTGRKNGRTIFGYVFASSYREVRKRLALLRSQQKAENEKANKDRNTTRAMGEGWLSESKAYLKASTIAKYSDYLRCYIYPLFGQKDMSAITNEDMSGFCRHLLLEGGVNEQGLAPKTVTEIFRVMKQLRKYALLHNCQVGFSPDCVSVKQKHAKLRVFSMQERDCLRKYLKQQQDPVCLGILLCLSTGLRLGELCALNWDDISLSEKMLHVGKTLQRIPCPQEEKGRRTKIVVTSPKSECSSRTIPLPEELCFLLVRERKPGTYLLTGEEDRFMEPRTMQNRFKAVLKACGIDRANFHALRHTFATAWVEAGLDVKCLSTLLGHSNIHITLNRYVHPSMELKRKNMEKIARFRL